MENSAFMLKSMPTELLKYRIAKGMHMEIRYSKDAIKFLKKLPQNSSTQIRQAIRKLTLNPPQGDIKNMKGVPYDSQRLRVGSWRVIFRYTTEDKLEILLVLEIGNRGDIYK
ncbi:MAG: type II toxin-antitoxin system RelE/ParE family toxin [Defluviitaleaceae bacterium]|nr:type II toxin-antitoxin system RelE/ParE family toxin [Defluviitaleaceae bacterium]